MDDNQIKLCTMYQKTSAAGNMYFFGRMGNLKVSLLLDRRASEPGKDPVWNLVAAEAEPYQSFTQSEPRPPRIDRSNWTPEQHEKADRLAREMAAPDPLLAHLEDRRHWTPEQRAAKHDEIMRQAASMAKPRPKAPRRPRTARKPGISAYDAQAPFTDDSAVCERMARGEI